MTGGASWANRSAWLSDSDVGDWYGVTSGDGRVVELSLPDNGLAGPLPAEIGNLTQLRVLNLSGNDLSGAFPGAVSGLSELTELRVGGNSGARRCAPVRSAAAGPHLRVLDFDGTGLCASPSPNFQAWFTAIAETSGGNCDNPDQVTLSLDMVYLTQSVQTPSRRVRARGQSGRTAQGIRHRGGAARVLRTRRPGGLHWDRESDEIHRVVMTRDDNRIPAEALEGDVELVV